MHEPKNAEDTIVTVGVDTHADVHVAAAIDQLGRLMGTKSVPSTPSGFHRLVQWASQFGVVDRIGVEGTGSWGAGLARWLRSRGLVVVEVDRPDRSSRRRQGKSDPIDAEAAARAVQAGKARTIPKRADGNVEMIRTLRVARHSAVQARATAYNQLHALVVTAPMELREQLRRLTKRRLVNTAAMFRPTRPTTTPTDATKLAMRILARRILELDDEAAELEAAIRRLIEQTAPDLLAAPGVGVNVAATLLVTAGDNPDRLHSEAAFAALCGTSPIEASSGRVVRHRLNRGGDRKANSALHTVVLCRMRWDHATKNYLARRLSEGKSKREAMRCIKRYLARQLYQLLPHELRPSAACHP